ncbi:MAG: tetratricopeptide repeat protein [Candidatus Methanofastidiosum sp.]|nr:tetratricopeptide repeat protein [Methanofastidiosum sp.]
MGGNKIEKEDIELNEANKYLAEGEYERAIKLYENYIENALKNEKIKEAGMAYHNMGIAYDNQKNYDKALDCFQKALECHKKIDNYRGITWAYYSIGLIFGELKNFKEMVEYNKKAIDYGAKSQDKEIVLKSYNGIGHALNELKDYSKSLEYLNKGLDLFDSGNSYYISETYYLRGISLDNMNRRKEAIESFSLAIDHGAKAGNEQIVALAFSKISGFQA